MRTAAAVIVSNEMIARDIYRMILKTDLGQEVECGESFERRQIKVLALGQPALGFPLREVGKKRL